MRATLLTFLTALTVLTSAGLGLARGTMPAEDGIVICHGQIVTTIWIDAQGNEVEAQVLCPDAALKLMVQVGAQTPEATAPLSIVTVAAERLWQSPAAQAQSIDHPARGPPRPV